MRDYATEQERGSDETRAYYRRLWDHGTRYPGVHSFRAGRTAGNMAYSMAGIVDPLHELDFVELHDAYTSSEIQTYEDLGLCRYGEGGPFAASGKAFMPGIDYGLELADEPVCPVNPVRRADRLRASGRRHRPDAGRLCHLAAAGQHRQHFGDRHPAGRGCQAWAPSTPRRHRHLRHGQHALETGRRVAMAKLPPKREETLGGSIVHNLPFPSQLDPAGAGLPEEDGADPDRAALQHHLPALATARTAPGSPG